MKGADIIAVYSELDDWEDTSLAKLVEKTGLKADEVEHIIAYLQKKGLAIYNLFGDIYLNT